MTAFSIDAGAVASELQVSLPERPYPGLRPFETHEWPIFFGREQMIDQVLDRLIQQRMVFVHGDSGCGKSSLVRAGLFAQLLNCAVRPWRVEIALPRLSPLGNVARALARAHGVGPGDPAMLDWYRALNFGEGAPAALAALREKSESPGPICLLIDQFEELFHHAHRHGPEEAQQLTDALVTWHRQPPEGLYVVLTMRSEYLGACARYRGLAEMVNATQYLLPRMSYQDVMRAIREPARLFDGTIARDLAERLIEDAGGGQDQLPLIQHGLMRLHQEHVRGKPGPWRLGLDAFPAGRGLAGLLSDHADQVAARCAVHLEGQETESHAIPVVENLFRALTDCSADGNAVRRPQTLRQLIAVIGASEPVLRHVTEEFRADGVSFLSPPPGQPLGMDDLVDVGHEALLRCWRVLADPVDGWLTREWRSGLIWRSLLVQADSYECESRSVLSPMTTDEREAWIRRRSAAWALRYGGGWDRVQRLLAASIASRDRERAANEEALRREGRTRVMRWGLGVLSVLVIGLVFALDVARRQLAESQLQFSKAQVAFERSEASSAAQRELTATIARSAAAIDLVQNRLQEAAGGVHAMEARRSGALSTQIDEVRSVLAEQVQKLSSAANVASVPAPALPVAAARVYMHIAEESQREDAAALQQELRSLVAHGTAIQVAAVEVVGASVKAAELRCFERIECDEEARRLLAVLGDVVESPRLSLQDFSERYGATPGIRPRHYELWFPPGPIVLRPAP
jgi:hypothetical protein